MFPDALRSLSKYEAAAALTIACLGYLVITGCYNLYLHPLAGFPGPRWAAFTSWWKVVLEVFQERSLVEQLVQLHEIYGQY